MRGITFVLPAMVLPPLAIGNLKDPLLGGSTGEVAAVDEPERGWLLPSWGM